MKQSLYIGKEPSFQTVIIASAILHMLFIALVTIPLKSREREYKSYYVNIVTPAEIQRKTAPSKDESVDTAQETPKTPVKVKPAPRRRVRPKKGVSLEPEKPEKKAAESEEQLVEREIERLRAISALEKQKEREEKKMARARESDEAVSEAIAEIRKRKLITVSRGAGIPGSKTTSGTESYYALITGKIWSEWIYPGFDTSGLEVIISIRIDTEGKVVSREIEQSSGNPLFDRSAMKAITKASPLPPPPVEMEIGVRFYP